MTELRGDETAPMGVDFQTVELQREVYYVEQAISDHELMMCCNLDEYRNECNMMLLRKLRYEVLTENLKESLAGDYFPTWWEHFKRDVFNPILKYLWETWSVSYKMTHKELTARALYPKLCPSLKDKGPIVRFYTQEGVKSYDRWRDSET